MVKQEQIQQSKAIQRKTGKTFHLATRVLPERVRHATYVLYAFFRVADEVVDAEETAEPSAQRERLEQLRAQALGRDETDDPVLSAFAELREQYDIADEDVNVFIDAMRSDITKSRYETYDELETYMDGSAAAVGRMMTDIMQTPNAEKARPHATALGEAFQMSNFLRDVREDIVERDRIYLPQETLEKHGVTEEQLQSFRCDENFRAVMREEMRRTEALYREGVHGIQYLPEDCQFAVLLAAVLYADHHRAIRKRAYDVLSVTPSLSTARKLALLVKTRAYWAVEKDPETVFRKVSVVPYPSSEDHSHHDTGHSGASRSPGLLGDRLSSWVRSFTRGE
ncbi:phytoene/squalene synthase family protein [Halogeometricum borinquense]|uniref:Phytoene/squalene synthase family protein n=1 Tax=Halogeometricum borinquense TaxID=60847 RepID=A0A6C0UK95_9EURY|nr:phytoene/squalene synthase family protein [Halogeometricum borinquense]QIB75023.1 phytoene/squalene synthase family protein [Halogeometricum borinquense]QIQ75997.1 phytoene/squalene synthase family protein [Halogeometricum borinquense]